MKTHKTAIIKSTIILFITLTLLLTQFSGISQEILPPEQNHTINLTYSFESPEIQTINIAGTNYHRVHLSELTTAGKAGEPKLPSKGIRILLPPQSTVQQLTVTTGNEKNLGISYYVEPIGPSIPMNQPAVVPTPNPQIYSSTTPYPENLFSQVRTYTFRGYNILVLLLHPIHYIPTTGELSYYESLELQITTTPDSSITHDLYRGYEEDRQEIIRKVDNPELITQYDQTLPPQNPTSDEYDLLILTTDNLKNGFDQLQQTHDSLGTSTTIKTLTDVGGTDPSDIRNYLRDAYMNWGVEYVLIGGDLDIVPVQFLWVSGMDENVTYYETTMPSDLFYSCLDGTYNYDGDNKWGEPTDGEGGGDVDLIADVYVGRACVGNTNEVNNFVTKTVAYLNKNTSDEYISRICLAGEYKGDYGVATWGGNYLDQLIDECSDDGYTTVGIPSDIYNITKLYDRDWPGHDWPKSEIMSIINNNVHIVCHDGHANYDYNMKMYNSDVQYLTNTKYCFIYSTGCNSGGFDDSDCIAEYFTIKYSTGAFAGLWNARYGWFWSYSTDGDSQRFKRQFWDAIFGEGIHEIGKANQDSKEDNLHIIGRSCIRWVYYGLNLFGDPTLYLTNATATNTAPETPTITGPSEGNAGEPYDYTVQTTDPETDEIYYYIDWGDNQTEQWIGPYLSGEEIQITHTYEKKGTYNISVRAKDTFNAMSDWATLQVTMPKSKPTLFTEISQIIQWLIQNFPLLEKLITTLLA